MPEKDPRQMSMDKVADMARRAGVQGVERMNKEEILRAMGDKLKSSLPGKNIPGHKS